jgi:P pilus assembly chaperone PapD
VAITNPAPGAGEPSVTHNIVKADDGDGKGFTTRFGSSMVAPNTTWTYWLAKGARDYSGSIQVTAVGDNGTTSTVTIT